MSESLAGSPNLKMLKHFRSGSFTRMEVGESVS